MIRRLLSTSTLLLAIAAGPAFAAAVGETAPAFQLKDLNGKNHSLADLKGKVVVLEWVNPNCPFSDRHAREKTMSELTKKYGTVTWLGINSTNPEHRDYLQPAAHLAWAKENGVTYSILYDPTGATGHAYDAKTTPHMFVIDETGKIVYNGAIDDDPSGRKAKPERVNYVNGALSAEQSHAKIDPASTKPYGCSIKY
ncbi:MAG: redoxin domain-containing protein [Acidobacteriota bacterium]